MRRGKVGCMEIFYTNKTLKNEDEEQGVKNLLRNKFERLITKECEKELSNSTEYSEWEKLFFESYKHQDIETCRVLTEDVQIIIKNAYCKSITKYIGTILDD